MNLKEKFSKVVKKENHKEKKDKNEKKSKVKRSVLDRVVIVFLALVLIGCTCGISIIAYIVVTTDASDLMGQMINTEPSSFLDDADAEFGELGMESRQNITYEQVPESVIDAFLAIEDSRFYKHNGFDLPRFISSAMNNLKTGSFSQGGSTLTMQAIDNFFMKLEEEALDKEGKHFNSVEKVERKLREIYMSMRLETQATKAKIMEKYLNQINFGGKARGIERGAQYFFGKSVESLNLAEAAYLAGCINAPNTYNPYFGYDSESKANYYKAAMERRDETLGMMLQHGFITETEYKLAKSTQLAFQITGSDSLNSDPYANYLYAAKEEVRSLTGLDPATTPMIIHTNLNRNAQIEANKVANGEVVSLDTNKAYQVAFTVLNNKTGGIVAFCPGRSDYQEELYKDRSSSVDHMPGSSIKPIIDYAYALDKTGFCTSRVFNDKAITVDGRTIQNSDGTYYGKISMERAIAQSLNTPAVNTLKASIEMNGQDAIIKYMTDLGFSENEMSADKFNLLYSIGGAISSSPLQMAAAYATLANGGVYTTPHYVTKIEFKDGKTDPIEIVPESKEVLSPQAAYMTSELLYKAIFGEYKGWNLMGRLGFGAYPVYGKTGTSDWADDGLKYGIPSVAMKDEWMINYTSEYTIATWTGFDAEDAKKGNYVTTQLLYENIPGWINKHMLDAISKNPTRIANPGGISSYGGGMIKTQFLKDAAKYNPMTIENMKSVLDELQGLYDKYKAYRESDYTAETYAKLLQALEKVKKLIDADMFDDDKIQQAKNELQSAVDALIPNVDKNSLINIINIAAGLDSNKYSAESYNNLKAIVDAAKGVLNKNKVTQAEINAQVDAINNAINALATPIDRSGLQNAINTATSIYAGLSDEGKKAQLQGAIDAANGTLNKADATQAELDAQVGALNNAIAAIQ